MLIDTMQNLGELSFTKSKKDLVIEVSLLFPLCLFIEWFSENCKKNFIYIQDSIKNHSDPGILTKPKAMQGIL